MAQSNEYNEALKDIIKERARQDAKWGEQNHDPFTWLAILQEEIGEFSQESLVLAFDKKVNPTHMYKEAVHVAAVAMAIVECLKRDKWKWDVDGRGNNQQQRNEPDAG